ISLNVITAVTLPNNKRYTFQYDPVYGLLRQITYPTGAWIKYDWAPNSQSDVADFYDSTSGNYSIRHSWPAISHRYVSVDGNNVTLQQDFIYSTSNWVTAFRSAAWGSKQTTVTSTDFVSGQVTKTVYSYTAQQSIPNDPFVTTRGLLASEQTI